MLAQLWLDLPQQQAVQKMETPQRLDLSQQQAAQKTLETPQWRDLSRQHAVRKMMETPQRLLWTDQMKVLAGQTHI